MWGEKGRENHALRRNDARKFFLFFLILWTLVRCPCGMHHVVVCNAVVLWWAGMLTMPSKVSSSQANVAMVWPKDLRTVRGGAAMKLSVELRKKK